MKNTLLGKITSLNEDLVKVNENPKINTSSEINDAIIGALLNLMLTAPNSIVILNSLNTKK